MASKKKERRQAVSFKDVQIAYLMNGVSAIEQLYNSGRASKATVRRALRELAQSGRNVEALEQFVSDQLGGAGRGRAAPSPGESRTYKAQQVKNGGPFLRLPLDVLGVKKGGSVRVRFERDQIIVAK